MKQIKYIVTLNLNFHKFILATSDINRENELIKNIIDFDDKIKIIHENGKHLTEVFKQKTNENLALIHKLMINVNVSRLNFIPIETKLSILTGKRVFNEKDYHNLINNPNLKQNKNDLNKTINKNLREKNNVPVLDTLDENNRKDYDLDKLNQMREKFNKGINSKNDNSIDFENISKNLLKKNIEPSLGMSNTNKINNNNILDINKKINKSNFLNHNDLNSKNNNQMPPSVNNSMIKNTRSIDSLILNNIIDEPSIGKNLKDFQESNDQDKNILNSNVNLNNNQKLENNNQDKSQVIGISINFSKDKFRY